MQKPDIDFFQKANVSTHVKNIKSIKPSGNKPMRQLPTSQKAMVKSPC
jgi:hypothetical protein